MQTKTITLLAGSRSAQVVSTENNLTTIHYTCPAYPGKTCIHQVPGTWQIKSQQLNKVTLVNHDVIIKDHEKVLIK